MKKILQYYKNALEENDIITFKGEVDRIEENYLVVILDNGQAVFLNKHEYNDLNVGDRLKIKSYIFDVEKEENETKIIKTKNIELQSQLFN